MMPDELKAKLEARLDEAERYLNPPNGQTVQLDWDQAQAIVQERARLENSLAQLQVAEATSAAAEAQLALAAAQDRATRESEEIKAAADDASFWFRRFMLSLQIGNGAAFVALASGIMQADDPTLAARVGGQAFFAFGQGLCFAGILPLLLSASRRDAPTWWKLELNMQRLFKGRLAPLTYLWTWKGTWRYFAFWAAILSAACFVWGVVSGIEGVDKLAHTKPVPAAQTKAGSPPKSPNTPVAKSLPPSPPREALPSPAQKSLPPGTVGQPATDLKGDRG